ncbi:hypothetical protein FPANT_14092, partial [Fusarium pseudoanthophilum]
MSIPENLIHSQNSRREGYLGFSFYEKRAGLRPEQRQMVDFLILNSTILTSAAPSILSAIGKAILSKGASYALEKGLVSITGGTDTDRIRKDIADVLTEVHQIQTSVNNLSTQLSSSLLQLRQDSLTVYITDIETYYTTVSDILQEGFDLPSKKLSEAEHKKQGNDLQNRLDSRLQASADTIPGYLDQINAFINQKGPTAFLKQAAQQALDDSEDFLGYYTKTKVLALNYWIAYAKGISLLQMAQQAANSFAARNGNWVMSNVEDPKSSWIMKPRYPVAADKFDLTGSYAVWVEPTDQPGHNLLLEENAAGLDTVWALENLDGGAWLIKPSTGFIEIKGLPMRPDIVGMFIFISFDRTVKRRVGQFMLGPLLLHPYMQAYDAWSIDLTNEEDEFAITST